eukprot:4711602-Karenia_brevis.AAC.1
MPHYRLGAPSIASVDSSEGHPIIARSSRCSRTPWGVGIHSLWARSGGWVIGFRRELLGSCSTGR